MIISFGWTADYLPPSGTKDTTRRIWKPRTLASWQKAWDENRLAHDAVNKCLAYGGKRIGRIILLERPFLQKLGDMPHEDVIREGGMVATVDEFIEKYFKGDRNLEVTVVRFSFNPTFIGPLPDYGDDGISESTWRASMDKGAANITTPTQAP